MDSDSCDLVLGAKGGLEKMAARLTACKWNVPTVMLVANEKDILRAEDVQMRLEYSPRESDRDCHVVPVRTKALA